MAYTPPTADDVVLEFSGAYTPPSATDVVLEFNESTSGQTITAVGFDTLEFGAIAQLQRNITLFGVDFNLGYGTPTVFNLNREIYPAGFDPLVFGATSINTQFITGVSAGDLLSFGTQWVSNWIRNVFPLGFVTSQFGAAIVYNKTQYITSVGFDALRLGALKVTYPQWLFPVGDDMLAFGTIGSVGPHIEVRTTGTDFGYDPFPQVQRIGVPTVFNRTNYVRPTGYDALSVGTQWVSNYIRDVDARGDDFAVVWQDDDARDPTTGLPAAYVGFDTHGRIYPVGIPPPPLAGYPDVYVMNNVRPRGTDFAVVPPPFVMAVNVVRDAGGLDALEFGDIDRWEDGKIKAHGDAFERWGVPAIAQQIRPIGFDCAQIGTPGLPRWIQASGADTLVIGDTTLAAEWGCPHGVIAGVSAGDQLTIGTPGVS